MSAPTRNDTFLSLHCDALTLASSDSVLRMTKKVVSMSCATQQLYAVVTMI